MTKLITISMGNPRRIQIPKRIHKLVKTISSKAKTSVMINRVTPAPIKVERVSNKETICPACYII